MYRVWQGGYKLSWSTRTAAASTVRHMQHAVSYRPCGGLCRTGVDWTLRWRILHCAVLCCTVLNVVLYCTVLYCTVLNVVLYCTVLYVVLYCSVLYCTIRRTVLYCTVLYCAVLYCTVLYCTVLYCTVPRYGTCHTHNPHHHHWWYLWRFLSETTHPRTAGLSRTKSFPAPNPGSRVRRAI
jgi:hypothetical protein